MKNKFLIFVGVVIGIPFILILIFFLLAAAVPIYFIYRLFDYLSFLREKKDDRERREEKKKRRGQEGIFDSGNPRDIRGIINEVRKRSERSDNT